MIRILFFLAVVFLLGLGFAWLADRPGDMVVTFSGYQYQVSLMVAAVTITAIVAAVMLSWWLVKSVWNSPYAIARYFRVRQRDRGYQALSTGMIAAGAGDAALARKMKKQAAKLIRSETEPLVSLLDAQASLLEGDHDAAREKFERMLDDPEMRLLGLRGLYLEAPRLGDRAAARHYAGRAADVAPQLGWALDSTLEEKTASGDWDAALALVDAQKATRQVDRDVINRRRAVLLTAKAEDLLDTDPGAAKAAAVEANRLAPDFVPAAVVAAKTLFRQNDIRKGAKILKPPGRRSRIPPSPTSMCTRGPATPCSTACIAPKSCSRSARTTSNRRWRWPAPHSTRMSSRQRALRPRRPCACSRAKAPTCCSPTSRRPRAATRAACGRRSPWRCARRATRPGWPTASSPTAGRRCRR